MLNKEELKKDWLSWYHSHDREDRSDQAIFDWLLSKIDQAVEDKVKEIREEIENIEEYIEANDNDGHRYQIPKSKQEKWDKFLDIPSDDEASWDVPEWADRIDGAPIGSAKDAILGLPSLQINNNKDIE